MVVWERTLTSAARALWTFYRALDRRFVPKPFAPKWAPAFSPVSRQTSRPPAGWPRNTDSLCPVCVKSLRRRILDEEEDVRILIEERVGEIQAQISERDGKVVIEKTCPLHGSFSDVLSINPEFLRRMERLSPGRDFASLTHLRDHGTSSIRFGRGSVLTVDLTNRCNMMCDPCFMDANQVGYVHELSLDEVKRLLDDAITVKPKRQLCVQFSGGEPTISPIFLDAIAYAREKGFYAVQAATNGIRFAENFEFAMKAREAGLRVAYLQFDGIGSDANAHRKVPNLFEVKLQAIENLYAAGIDVVLVVTVVNTVNNDQVGPIIRFAIDNCEKVSFVAFQPVSFTGRYEDIDDETRVRQRYTLSHLAEDVKRQTGLLEPLRDWFPLSAAGAVSDLTDLAQGPDTEWGTMKCGCHPHCGVSAALMISKRTKEWAPLTRFIDVERLFEDFRAISDAGRGPFLTKLQTAVALLRNYDPRRAPKDFRLFDLIKKFDKQSGGAISGELGARDNLDRKADEWLILFIAGMWFQDLWTYDFRRTEMCVIPYATQEGEISFCAYNTGVGWRQIVEDRHQNATVAEWYRDHERHPIYAHPRKEVPLPMYPTPVALERPEGQGIEPSPENMAEVAFAGRACNFRILAIKGR